jgi:hypothetical protein
LPNFAKLCQTLPNLSTQTISKAAIAALNRSGWRPLESKASLVANPWRSGESHQFEMFFFKFKVFKSFLMIFLSFLCFLSNFFFGFLGHFLHFMKFNIFLQFATSTGTVALWTGQEAARAGKRTLAGALH